MKREKKDLSRNLQRLRKAKGLSQAELADLSGISKPTIANIERGISAEGASLRTMTSLGSALNVPVWVLIEPSLCERGAA